jgi:hypothetical protein
MACEIKQPRYGLYCSVACRREGVRVVDERECRHCKEKFLPDSKDVKLGHGHWCSRLCYNADRPAVKSYKKVGSRHEHRIVAEQKLGRPLAHGEIVHHIDGDIRNNAPENLEVVANQALHAAMHAEEILTYARSRRGPAHRDEHGNFLKARKS